MGELVSCWISTWPFSWNTTWSLVVKVLLHFQFDVQQTMGWVGNLLDQHLTLLLTALWSKFSSTFRIILFTHFLLVCKFLTLRLLHSSHQSSLFVLWWHLPLWFYSQVLHSGITTFTFWLYSQVLHAEITSLTPFDFTHKLLTLTSWHSPFDFTHKFFILRSHHSPPLTVLTRSLLCHHNIHLLTLLSSSSSLTTFDFTHKLSYSQITPLNPFDFTHKLFYSQITTLTPLTLLISSAMFMEPCASAIISAVTPSWK